MDLQCILYITNASYAVKTTKDEVNCDTYQYFYQKLIIWTCPPQSGRFWDQTGVLETTSQNGSLPFKTGGLEHMCIMCIKPMQCQEILQRDGRSSAFYFMSSLDKYALL